MVQSDPLHRPPAVVHVASHPTGPLEPLPEEDDPAPKLDDPMLLAPPASSFTTPNIPDPSSPDAFVPAARE
jgi:hypothetical protein